MSKHDVVAGTLMLSVAVVIAGCTAEIRDGDGRIGVHTELQDSVVDAMFGQNSNCYSSAEDGSTWCRFRCGINNSGWCEGRIDADTIRRVQEAIEGELEPDQLQLSPTGQLPLPPGVEVVPLPGQRSASSFGAVGESHLGTSTTELMVVDSSNGQTLTTLSGIGGSWCEWIPLPSTQNEDGAWVAQKSWVPTHRSDFVDGMLNHEELHEDLFPNLTLNSDGFVEGWSPLQVLFQPTGLGSGKIFFALPWDYGLLGDPQIFGSTDDGRYSEICKFEEQYLDQVGDLGDPESWSDSSASLSVIQLAGNAQGVLQWLYDRIAVSSFDAEMSNTFIPGHGFQSTVDLSMAWDHDTDQVTITLTSVDDPEAQYAHTIQLLPRL